MVEPVDRHGPESELATALEPTASGQQSVKGPAGPNRVGQEIFQKRTGASNG